MTVWEWAQVALLVANLGWTTLCLGGFRPDTMIVTTSLTAALVAVHLLGWSWLQIAAEAAAATESAATASRDTPALPATRSKKNDSVEGGDGGSQRFHPAGWWLLPFLGYAAVNVLVVAPGQWLGWLDWMGWAQLAAVFWVVLNGVRSRPARATLVSALMTLGFVAVALAAYQKFVRPDWLMLGRTQAVQYIGRSSGPFGTPNSLAALLLLLLPPALALTTRRGASAVQRVLFGYLTLVFAFGLALTISRGAWLSLLLALSLWPMVSARGSWVRRAGLTALMGGALVAMGLGLSAWMPGVRARLDGLRRDSGEITRPIMWRGAWGIFREHPAWGGGAGSYNVLFEKYRPERFQDEPRWAHNEYLNTLSDYGLAGFGLFFGGWGAIIWFGGRRRWSGTAQPPGGEAEPRPNRWRSGRRLARRENGIEDRLVIAGFAVGLAAFGFQLFVDLNFRLPALTLAFGVMAALAMQGAWSWSDGREARGAQVGRTRSALIASGVGIALAAGFVGCVLPLYRGEALRYMARQSIDGIARQGLPVAEWRPLLLGARAALARAVELSPSNGAAWADLSYATALWGHVEPGQAMRWGREAEQAADRALALSKMEASFWVRRGVALDIQGRWREAGLAFDEAVRLAPARAGVWYNYAFHLAIERSAAERARAAVEYCLRLDGGNREAQALRRRLADRSRAP